MSASEPVGIDDISRRARMEIDGATPSDFAGGYKGGRKDRRALRNWRPKGGSADADVLLDLPDLRARSRDLARNTPVAAGAIVTTVTGVLGSGLELQASIDHESLGITAEQADIHEREQERLFAAFARRCDFTGVQCFDELQELCLRAEHESGDALIIRRYRKDAGDVFGTKLQVIEADRLCNANRAADTDTLAGGVEMTTHGVPLFYHVADKHPGSLRTQPTAWERIPARTADGLPTVIHLFTRTRPDLTRGVPYLAGVIEHLKQISDYSDAEVTAAVVGAMMTVFIETPIDEDAEGNPAFGERRDGNAVNEVGLGNGAVMSLEPGEKANLVNPSRPNPQYDAFWKSFMCQVGVALELPVELLIKHFEASYSASRAALEMAWQTFKRKRDRFANRFCDEVYGWAMDEAVASGLIRRPGYFADPLIRAAWLGAEWIGPPRFSLQPQQEAAADEIDMRLGVKTGEQVCRERTGGEIEKKLPQRAKEMTMAREAGLVPEPAQQGAPRQASNAPPPDDPADDGADPPDALATMLADALRAHQPIVNVHSAPVSVTVDGQTKTRTRKTVESYDEDGRIKSIIEEDAS